MNEVIHILRIGDLADRYGVSTESLRVWERQGLIPPPVRTPGGHRRYSDQHVRALNALMGTPLKEATPAAALSVH